MVKRILLAFLLLNFILNIATSNFLNLMKTEETYPGAHILFLNNENSTLDGVTLTENNTNVSIEQGSNIVHYEKEYANVPNYGEAKEESEKHSIEECNQEKLITIKKEGTYIVSGTLKGQLAIQLNHESTKQYSVTLVLKGVNIDCKVAPGVIFYKAFEMDTNDYESEETQIEFSKAIGLDPEEAGAKIIIADDSENTVSGSHVAKCFRYNKNADGTITMIQPKRKRAKYDGAFYSKVSMSINCETKGNGILNIIADSEGLDSEKHLIILGGNINIASQDDGINANNDWGSVVLIKGGNIKINGGLGSGGEGIDSNGYLIIQQGTVVSAGHIKYYGLSAELGIVINGGTAIGMGSIQSFKYEQNSQQIMHLRFSSEIPKNSKLRVKDSSGKILISFSPLTCKFISGTDVRRYQGALISLPSFEFNQVYYLYLDNTQLHVRTSKNIGTRATSQLHEAIESLPIELNMTSNISTFDVFIVNNTESSISKIDFSFRNWFIFLLILF